MEINLLLVEERPKRSDALENHALLLETAQHLFAEHGVENVSMSAIAEAAGVGKGTLYRNFPNKAALCQALLDEDQRALQARTFSHLGEIGEPIDQLRWFLGEAFAFVSRNLPLLYVDGVHGCHSMLEHPAHLWWRMTIRGLIARANPHADADISADALYVLLDPRTIAFQRNVLGYDHDRIISGMLALAEQLTS